MKSIFIATIGDRFVTSFRCTDNERMIIASKLIAERDGWSLWALNSDGSVRMVYGPGRVAT